MKPESTLQDLTSVWQLSLSSARSIWSMNRHPGSWRSTLILFSNLCLSLPSGILPSRFPTKNHAYTSPLPPVYYMPRPSILLDFITRIIYGKQQRSYSSSLCRSPLSCCLVPLRPKYSPQRPIIKHHQPMFISQRKRPSLKTQFVPRSKHFSSRL